MTRLLEVWRAWVALMDRRESPVGLALLRIACALVLLGDQLWVRHVGLVVPMWSPPPDGFAIASSSASPNALSLVAITALACVAIGLFARPACVAFVLASAQMAALAPDTESAIDVLMRVVFLVLALSQCNACWSVDAWIRRRVGRPMPERVPAWPRYVLMLQLVWVYFSAGINKSSGNWGPQGGFSALANALLDPDNGRLAPAFVVAVYPLTRIATALTMAFELGAIAYPLLYRARGAWWRRVRWAWLGLGIAFEVGIAVGLRLGAFPFGMLALFPALMRPEELARLQRRRNTEAPA